LLNTKRFISCVLANLFNFAAYYKPFQKNKMAVTPYKDDTTGKKEQVATMFNNIAYKYDFLNHFLSLGIDILWRKKAIRLLRKENPKQILDIATGTADFAIEALALKPDKVTGIDISEGMLIHSLLTG
jgi:demethylmenaquinone methyltransferase/2-methoxy-6-polyprenyl-1,4-benzoquinol methylase